MKVTYRLLPDDGGFTAECLEPDVSATGTTEADAIASLRRALEERLFRPDAIAPPSRPPNATIELVRTDA